MTDTRKKILVAVYVLLTGVVLLYILFPSDSVKNYIINTFHLNAPNMQMTVGSLRLTFPPGVSIRNIALLDNETEVLNLDQVSLYPKWIQQ